MTRRFATRLGGALGALLLATTAAWAYEQAPMLVEMEAAGDLPPVDERLPANPLEMDLIEGVGEYGGTMRRAILGGGDHHNMVRTIGSDNLVRWDATWSELRPNIAEGWEVSEDARSFTFTLREGMRWSDGAPFTADDIVFWYEDVFLNTDITPSKHPIYVDESGPVTVEKVDDVTVRFSFENPNGLFVQNLAYGFGYYPVSYARHYLEQFHETYNPDGIQALIDAEPAANDWVQLFRLKAGEMHTPLFWQNPDRPTLHAWHLTNAYGSSDRVEAVRNPYYWKVDSAGNQLPYMDRITYDQVEDVETILLKAFNGEIDFMLRHIGRPSYKAVLTDNMERGKYRFFDVNDLPASAVTLMLNLNNEDPVKREIVQNPDFRRGLSLAVNRQEIIDLLYFGAGNAAQASPQPTAALYDEEFAKQFTEFDPDAAGEYLDKAGLSERDGDGFRLGPDGERFTLIFMVADVFGLQYPDVMQLVAGYAADVGLDIQVRATDRSRLMELVRSNEQDAYLWNCGGGQADMFTAPMCYVPRPGNTVNWAMRWAEWNVDNSTGEEPPEDVKAIFAAYNKVLSAATPEDQEARMREMLALSKEQLFVVGLIQNEPVFGIARNNVRNVPDPLPIAGQLWFPAPYTAQMYFEGGDNLP